MYWYDGIPSKYRWELHRYTTLDAIYTGSLRGGFDGKNDTGIWQVLLRRRQYFTVLNLDFDKASSINDKATVVEKFNNRD